MNEKIREHIDQLFENAPKTRKAFELKEELLANSEERYQDLIANGVKQEDAIKNVINSIGNVSELFQGLEDINQEDRDEMEARIKKVALIKAMAVGLYIFSVVVFLSFSAIYTYDYQSSTKGLILMILIDIIPTCMLVYITSLNSRYRKQEDTVVEEFKEWKSGSLKTKSLKNAISAVIWTSAVLFYFAISFATFAWYATWIIFLVALCIQAVIELIFRLKDIKG